MKQIDQRDMYLDKRVSRQFAGLAYKNGLVIAKSRQGDLVVVVEWDSDTENNQVSRVNIEDLTLLPDSEQRELFLWRKVKDTCCFRFIKDKWKNLLSW